MSNSSVLHASPVESNIANGLLQGDRAELANRLSEALADTYLLYLKTQAVHWNVVGPMFFGLHKLTESQYQDMAEAIDSIAERIRAIGFLAPGSFKQFSQLSSFKELTEAASAKEMIQQLLQDNEICSRNLRNSVAEAEKVEDVHTADLLTARIGSHEQNAWMLRSLLE